MCDHCGMLLCTGLQWFTGDWVLYQLMGKKRRRFCVSSGWMHLKMPTIVLVQSSCLVKSSFLKPRLFVR